MPIPLLGLIATPAMIQTALQVVAEALRAFNGLPEEVRGEIARDMLKDKQARDKFFSGIVDFFRGLKVEPDKPDESPPVR